MTIQVRTFLIKEINGWVEIALHDNLYAKPSLHRGLGVKTVPAQSTFWRAWNHCFSEELRDGVQKCAAMIVKATCVCDVSLPERVTAADTDEPQTDDRPEHQLLAFLNWLI